MEVAAKTYPSVVAAAVNMAIVQIGNGDYNGALKTLAVSDQSDSRILLAYGNAYMGMGNQNKAREAWSQAAAKGNAEAKHNLEELDKYVESL